MFSFADFTIASTSSKLRNYTDKDFKADRNWSKKADSNSLRIKAYNKAVKKANSRLADFNDKWGRSKYSDLTKRKNNDRYMQAGKKIFDKALNESVEELIGTKSPSGRFNLKIETPKFGGIPTMYITDTY